MKHNILHSLVGDHANEIIFQSDSANNGGPNVSQKPFLGSGSGPFTPQKPFLGEPFTTGPGLLIQKII